MLIKKKPKNEIVEWKISKEFLSNINGKSLNKDL